MAGIPKRDEMSLGSFGSIVLLCIGITAGCTVLGMSLKDPEPELAQPPPLVVDDEDDDEVFDDENHIERPELTVRTGEVKWDGEKQAFVLDDGFSDGPEVIPAAMMTSMEVDEYSKDTIFLLTSDGQKIEIKKSLLAEIPRSVLIRIDYRLSGNVGDAALLPKERFPTAEGAARAKDAESVEKIQDAAGVSDSTKAKPKTKEERKQQDLARNSKARRARARKVQKKNDAARAAKKKAAGERMRKLRAASKTGN